MRIRLIIEVDFPAQQGESPRKVQARFGQLTMQNFVALAETIEGEIVYIATEVVSAGDTIFNMRKKP